ncbi:MAG: hypothetical protein M1831_001525 [Alyxoria varia]|nr:MAG: hypothetical protein M1831_001525 [Alyxoria varia]
MASQLVQQGLSAGVIAIDFFLSGNALTQSTMTLPSLIASFPSKSTDPTDHAYRSRLLGTQWPVCWRVGNVIMRPLSTVSTLSYAFISWSSSRAGNQNGVSGKDWRPFAFAAILHLTVIIHSAVNLQPVNDKLAGLAGRDSAGEEKKKKNVNGSAGEKEKDAHGSGVDKKGDENEDAVALATKWIRWNYYRAVVPMLTGGIALWQSLA